MNKIKSSKEFWSGGMIYRATVEQSDNGGGDGGYPTKISISSDGGGNFFDVETDNFSTDTGTIELCICGEWEAFELGNLFVWIGNEINRIHAEIRDNEVKA